MKDDVISRVAAADIVRFECGEWRGLAKTIIDEFEALPTVDAVPVRLGRWIKKRYWSEGVGMGERYGYYYSCSKCGNLVCGGYDECGKKYCDECGARMDVKDGDGNDNDMGLHV